MSWEIARGFFFPQAFCFLLFQEETSHTHTHLKNINRLIISVLICSSSPLFSFSLHTLLAHLLHPSISFSPGRENPGEWGGGELSHKISQGRNEVLIKKAGVLCKWLMHRRQPNECARSGWGAFYAPTAGSQEGQAQAGVREHNPSDWQLCPLVTVWLSPKLLYFTEIMIFYGHRFEDNCCILGVVVLQGDAAAGWGRGSGGSRGMMRLACSIFAFLGT